MELKHLADFLRSVDQSLLHHDHHDGNGNGNGDGDGLRHIVREGLEAYTNFVSLFRWHDGPLVQAMREGSFILLDEISLADDAVLERLNRYVKSLLYMLVVLVVQLPVPTTL
jgi:midasin (ATPase involved in ribosome maturation)